MPDLPLMEDVALARALKKHLVQLPSAAQPSAAKYLSNGWLRQGASNIILCTRFLRGADPERLVRAYR